MNNKILFILIILLALGFQSAFAQEASASTSGNEVPELDVEFVQKTHPDADGESADVDAEGEQITTTVEAEADDAVESEGELAQDTEAEEEAPVVVAEDATDTDVVAETESEPTTETKTETVVVTETDPNVPITIRNNQYYLESLKQSELAKSTYDEGEYDDSSDHAAEAIRQAELSDEYVALQLKRRAANKAITSAKQRLDWASTSGAAKEHPDEYSDARGFYDSSLTARSEGKWEEAYDSATRVLEILAQFDAPAGSLPAQYTVRPWVSTKDCLWNIAGQPWAYNDPFKWKLLYDANKSKLPEPENPDLIEPSMVLTIPSIKGEARQGMYDPAKNYSTIK